MEHHAYYQEGPLSGFEALRAELKPISASAYERFGVDEARELIALASLKNFAEAVYLIGASQITTEAQQALLKLLEEPQAGTTFVFLVPHGALLPTVKSRMQEWGGREAGRQNGLARETSAHDGSAIRETRGPFDGQAAAFLKASGKERSEMVGELLDDDEGVRERVRDFLNALEALLAQDSKKHAAALQEIAMVRDYLRDRSPSLKMLLEHLALAL